MLVIVPHTFNLNQLFCLAIFIKTGQRISKQNLEVNLHKRKRERIHTQDHPIQASQRWWGNRSGARWASWRWVNPTPPRVPPTRNECSTKPIHSKHLNNDGDFKVEPDKQVEGGIIYAVTPPPASSFLPNKRMHTVLKAIIICSKYLNNVEETEVGSKEQVGAEM